jgi:hypothetical protein
MELKALAAAAKTIDFFGGWSEPEEDDGYSYFLAPLAIKGVTEAGFFLFGGTYPGLPERHVTFEMRLLLHGGSKTAKLMRIDWRSLRGGHTNQRRYACPHPCPRRTTETHFHTFDANYDPARKRMRGHDLPCAIDIEPALNSYEALKGYCGIHFQINNIDVVARPEWEYKLL